MDSLKNLKKSFKSLKWYEWIMAIIMIAIAGLSVYNAFKDPASSSNPPWLTIVNFISAICGVVCIFFCAKASISNYFFGLINTIVYAVFLAYHGIRGTLCLELFVYLPVNILGWIVWVKHRDKVDTEKTMAKKLTEKQMLDSVMAVLIIAIVCFFGLNKLNGKVPELKTLIILDALTVAIGIVATVLQFRRYREQYVWWLIQDIIAVGMYIVMFDPVYLTKKSIYLIMAVIGLYNWVKLQKTRNEENV